MKGTGKADWQEVFSNGIAPQPKLVPGKVWGGGNNRQSKAKVGYGWQNFYLHLDWSPAATPDRRAKYEVRLSSCPVSGSAQALKNWPFQSPTRVKARNFLTIFKETKLRKFWAVVVAHLVERSLPTPEICGSNPVNSKILSINCTTYRKDKNEEKRPGMGHL